MKQTTFKPSRYLCVSGWYIEMFSTNEYIYRHSVSRIYRDVTQSVKVKSCLQTIVRKNIIQIPYQDKTQSTQHIDINLLTLCYLFLFYKYYFFIFFLRVHLHVCDNSCFLKKTCVECRYICRIETDISKHFHKLYSFIYTIVKCHEFIEGRSMHTQRQNRKKF